MAQEQIHGSKVLSCCQSEVVQISRNMQIETVARAPAKVILCGEHAVVEGATAVAAAIPFFTQARLRKFLEPSHGVIRLELPTRNLNMSWELGLVQEALIKEIKTDPRIVMPCTEDTLAAIKKLVKEQLPCDVDGGLALGVSAFMFLIVSILGLQPAIVTITTEIPTGSGLGSSAAFCVALSGAFLASISQLQYDTNIGWCKVNKDGLELINKWAFEGEKIIHGRPSGIDNTVSTFGTIIKFKLGSIIQLEPKRPLKILVTNTNVERNTKALIDALGRHVRDGTTSSHFRAIDALAEKAFNILQSICNDSGIATHSAAAELGSLERKTNEELELEKIIAENQRILQSMGVSHASIDDICSTTSRYSLQSKLTGGGGGGCVITLLPSNTGPDILDKLMVDLSSKSFKCWQVDIGCEGSDMDRVSSPGNIFETKSMASQALKSVDTMMQQDWSNGSKHSEDVLFWESYRRDMLIDAVKRSALARQSGSEILQHMPLPSQILQVTGQTDNWGSLGEVTASNVSLPATQRSIGYLPSATESVRHTDARGSDMNG